MTGTRTGLRPAAVLPAALLGLLPVLFIPICYDSYVLPRASLAIVGACLGLALCLIRPAEVRRRLGVLCWPALAVAVAALLAGLFSAVPSLSLIGSYGRYESATMRLAYLALFISAAVLVRGELARRLAVWAFLAGCVIVSLEAVYEGVYHTLPRPDGNLGQANLLGALLAMAVPLCVNRTLRAPGWALALVPIGAGLALSQSRSGWIGAFAGLLALAPVLLTRNRLKAAIAVAAAVAAALGLVVASPLGHLNQDTGTARLHVWADSLPLIAGRPLFGWGEDALGLVFGAYLRGDWQPGATFDRVHELGLDLLAAQGLVGLAACALFFGRWAWEVWGAAPADAEVGGLLAAWAGYVVATSINFDWAPQTAPLWLLAGVAWSALADRSAATPPPAPPSPHVRGGRAFGWVLLTAAALVFGVAPVVADLAHYRGDDREAVGLDPLQPEYHRSLGLQEINGGDLPAGVAQLQTAARLGESDPEAFVALGDAQLRLGRSSDARASYQRALRLDRFDPTPRQRLAALR